jgi:hypothetical protein
MRQGDTATGRHDEKEIFDGDIAASPNCSVCGGAARRDEAKFCAVCGHDLREGYAPLDVLRASYNLRETKQKTIVSRPNNVQVNRLFEENVNGASTTAMACVVYSLVPYLGILFCPGALLLGGIGLAVSYQKPQLGGRQTATYSILLGTVVFGIQILLWWLLYIIPELGRRV